MDFRSKMKFINTTILTLIFLLFLLPINGTAQEGFFLPEGKKHGVINFELVNNLVLIPVTINGSDFTFLLDTGSSHSVIFSFEAVDSLTLNNSTVIQLRGLSKDEPIMAVRSDNNVMEIGNAKNEDISLYVIFDGVLNFTSRLGVPIHGIIGTDFFRDFIVHVNYSSRKIKFYNPKSYTPKKCRACVELPLIFINDKPYIEANIETRESSLLVNLLIDSGSGDALWLFQDEKQLFIPEEAFDDYLGMGINGDIFGKRHKLKQLSFSGFDFKNVNVAYPDVNFLRAQFLKGIDGSIGGEIFRRFNWVVDYQSKKILIKSNRYYKEPFHYNMSGITLEHGELTVVREKTIVNENIINRDLHTEIPTVISNYENFKLKLMPSYIITEVRKNSPAHKAGLEPGDELLEINDVPVHKYRLFEINNMFYTNEGSRMKLKVKRKTTVRTVRFILEDIK